VDEIGYPSLANLAWMNAQLAVEARRVESLVDAQLDEVERLFRAAASQDWDAIARATRDLASRRINPANKVLVQSARGVRDALRRDPSGGRASLRLAELLAACRSTKVEGDVR
jgi:hypothetical protein